MGNDLPLTKSKYRYLVFTSTDYYTLSDIKLHQIKHYDLVCKGVNEIKIEGKDFLSLLFVHVP